jgi:RNA polymerase sigma factor (TIGR02999 family)
MTASKDTPLTELTPALYRDLRRIASRHLSGERPNHTLQATALVHEAYLKLAKELTPCFSDEVHLLAVASRVMRQVLVDYARSSATQKRKGQANSLDLITTVQIKGEGGLELIEVLMLDDALVALAAEDDQLARVIEMRYFDASKRLFLSTLCYGLERLTPFYRSFQDLWHSSTISSLLVSFNTGSE